jgi:hypothetical protein
MPVISVAGRSCRNQYTTGEIFMMKKTCLCILGLLLLGMLCVPVAAGTGDQDYWSFYVVNDISAATAVKLNGDGELSQWRSFEKVNVADSLDQVVVKFDVYGGPDTNLTITKEYITMLREAYPDQEPVLQAWGLIDTYDVDAGGLYVDAANTTGGKKLPYSSITVYEHLRKRGAVHHAAGEILDTHRLSSQDPVERYVMDNTGDQDCWSFYLIYDIPETLGYLNVNEQKSMMNGGYFFEKVNVANSVDQVVVKFVVYGGPDTTLTITKDSINNLRKTHPRQEPALNAWGLIDTYDVDSGVLNPGPAMTNAAVLTTCEHLKKRGLIHNGIGKTLRVYYDPNAPVVNIMS